MNSQHIKNRNDIKSDLNGIFKKCLESKCKTVELGGFFVKIIFPKKKENWMKTNSVWMLIEGKIYMD